MDYKALSNTALAILSPHLETLKKESIGATENNLPEDIAELWAGRLDGDAHENMRCITY